MFFTLVKKIERQIPHKYREKQRKSGFISHFLCLGGEKGIRTLDTVPRIHDFQSCALDQLSHLSTRREYYTPSARILQDYFFISRSSIVGLQYILDSKKKKDEGFAQIGYCEFVRDLHNRKEVQIPHGKNNTQHEVSAIPNLLRAEIWRIQSVAEVQPSAFIHLLLAVKVRRNDRIAGGSFQAPAFASEPAYRG